MSVCLYVFFLWFLWDRWTDWAEIWTEDSSWSRNGLWLKYSGSNRKHWSNLAGIYLEPSISYEDYFIPFFFTFLLLTIDKRIRSPMINECCNGEKSTKILLSGWTVNDYLENGFYPRFWYQIFNNPLGCAPALLKPRAGGHLPSSNLKIGKSYTPTNLPSFSKYCVNVNPLYKILGFTRQESNVLTSPSQL